MISRRFSLWQKVVALAPLLLVAVYLPGQMMLRCRIDGQLRPACCCPSEGEPQDSGPAVKAQDCCDREVSAGARPVVEAAGRAEPGLLVVAAIMPVAAPSLTALAPMPPVDWAAQRYGPAREGPPIVLLKHAFLI